MLFATCFFPRLTEAAVETSLVEMLSSVPPKIFQFASSVPVRLFNRKGCALRDFFENHIPKSQIAGSVPVRSFRESSPQSSNRKRCPPQMFQRIIPPNLKSQATSSEEEFFRESSPQISKGKQRPPQIFQRNIFPNLKSQAEPPKFFPKFQIASSVSLLF